MNKSHLTRIILILVILCSVSAVNVAVVGLALLPDMNLVDLYPFLTTGFSLFAFVFTGLIAAYHLSTMLRTKKRKEDRMPMAAPSPAH